jgi:hypothetical protein
MTGGPYNQPKTWGLYMIRIHLRPVFVVLAMICFFLFLGCPLLFAAVALVLAPVSVSIPMALFAVVFVLALGYAMSSSYQWVELEGSTIRGQKLLTRRVVERPVSDLVDAAALHSKAMGPLENALMDAVLKTSDRGYELRFRDGTKIGLVRGEMAGFEEFLGAVAEAIEQQK